MGMHCCKTAGGGIVVESRLAGAVQGVASIAAEVIPVADDGVCSRDANDGLVGEGAEGIVEERGYACGVMGFDLATECIIRERDCRCVVGVDGVGKATPDVVGIVGCYAARPDALRELAIGSVGVRWALAIGIYFVCH